MSVLRPCHWKSRDRSRLWTAEAGEPPKSEFSVILQSRAGIRARLLEATTKGKCLMDKEDNKTQPRVLQKSLKEETMLRVALAQHPANAVSSPLSSAPQGARAAGPEGDVLGRTKPGVPVTTGPPWEPPASSRMWGAWSCWVWL